MNAFAGDGSGYDFRGDLAAVSAMMARSWAANKDQSLLYSPEFLTNAFEYPFTKKELATAIYSADRPIAFVAGFPRSVRFGGEVLHLAVNTFLTVDPDFQGKAYGRAVWSEFATRTRAAGYDGTMNFCVDGSPSNHVIQKSGDSLGFCTARIYCTSYLVRLLRPATQAGTTAASGADVGLFLELAAGISAPLSRIWSPEEAQWQCLTRYGALCVRHESGPRRGLLTGYVMDVIGGGKSLLIEDLLWGSLEGAERIQLLDKLLAAGAAAGAEMAVAPRMGYADEEPLTKGGFRRSRRLVHTYLTTWNERPAQQPLASQYIDIF